LAARIVHVVDVGTTKIVAVVGRVDGRRGLAEVLSYGEAPSHGLKRGVVVDREAARDSVAEAVEACGGPAGFRGPAIVGIAGGHISSFNAEVTLLNRSRDRRITERFVKRLESEARRAGPVDEDLQVIHVVPRSFVLDGTEGVKQPVGLAARRATMRAHVVSGAVGSIQNLLGAVEDSGVRISRVVLEPLASSEACLLDADREMGVALLDIGGGTTDLAVFSRGVLAHTAVVPLGGESFTGDVAYGLKVPFDVAEQLKVRYGTVLSKTVDSVAAVPLHDKHYSAHFIAEILEYRALEVLEYARDTLDDAGLLDRLPGGVAITGGGSLLDGMDVLAERVLGMRTQIVAPRRVKGDVSKPLQKPQYSTAVGLLYFGAKNDDLRAKSKGAGSASFGSIVTAIKEWFGF
jgi:cell division protein FtsA